MKKNKYFGTDGFRGEANVELCAHHAFKIGRFLGCYRTLNSSAYGSHRPKIAVGKDTRRSSYMLEYALAAGVVSSGADAYMLHVTTTPSVSYVTRTEGFDFGVMISASHNPYYDNGIKIVDSNGEKISDDTAAMIEAYIDGDFQRLGLEGDLPLATRDGIGSIIDHFAGRNRYVGYLISLASNSFKSLKIGLDCANGASWMIARAVFEALGAKTVLIGGEPNGTNINLSCGSTNISALCDLVRENRLDMGFAFDGDADRCIAVDENGHEVNGDHILYILTDRLRRSDSLENNTIAATVMSNSGLFRALDDIGINCIQTAVGDRFVYEVMQKEGYSLGGEQSGHIIIKKYATTGDGILTAIMVAEEVLDRKTTLSSLARPVIFLPQVSQSVRVKSKSETVADPEVQRTLGEIRSEIGKNGRILLRESGTEPVIRVMVEFEGEAKCRHFANRMITVIKERGLACE